MTLSTSLDYLKPELAVYTAQCKALIDQNSVTISKLKGHKSRTENVSNSSCLRESECRLKVVRLGQLMESVCRDGAGLFLSNVEAEAKCIVLQGKLIELETAITSLKQSNQLEWSAWSYETLGSSLCRFG